MKMIFSELYFKFKSSKLNNLIFVLQFIFCMLLTIFVINEFSIALLNKKEADKTFIDSQYYTIFDNYVGEKETEFLKEQDNLERLSKFYNALMAKKDIEFLVQTKQPIEFLDPLNSSEEISAHSSSVPLQFFYSYESGRDVQSHPYQDERGKAYLASPLKSIQVNENTVSHYNFKITDGRLFNQEDYIYKSNNIPVLLGSSYKGIFEIGDVFTGWYFGNRTFRIIGFLEPATYVIDNEEPLDLSRYIVSPSPVYSKEIKSFDVKKALINIYLQKTNGVIVTQKNAVYLNNYIAELCDSLNLERYSTGKYNPSLADILKIEFNQFIMLCGLLLFTVLFFSLFGLSLNLIGKLREDTIELIPYLLCGMGIKSIKATISLEVLIIFFISSTITLCILEPILYIPLIYGVIGILIFGMITAIVLTILLRKLNQMDLSQFMKVDE